MSVEEMIAVLEKMPKKAKVQVEYKGDGGCESCGYGSEEFADVEKGRIHDLETRVVISIM